MTPTERTEWREAAQEMDSTDDFQGLLAAYFGWVHGNPEAQEILERAIA